MDNLFIFNPTATRQMIQDGISCRIERVKAIIDTLMSGQNGHYELSEKTLTNALWSVDILIGEIDVLQQRVWNY